MHEQADLGHPGQPVGEAQDGPPVRQPGVAEHHPGDVDGEETGGVRDGPRRVRQHGQTDRRDRVEPGRRAERPGAASSGPTAPTVSPITAPADNS